MLRADADSPPHRCGLNRTQSSNSADMPSDLTHAATSSGFLRIELAAPLLAEREQLGNRSVARLSPPCCHLGIMGDDEPALLPRRLGDPGLVGLSDDPLNNTAS